MVLFLSVVAWQRCGNITTIQQLDKRVGVGGPLIYPEELEVLFSQGKTTENDARQIGIYYRWSKEYGGTRTSPAKHKSEPSKLFR